MKFTTTVPALCDHDGVIADFDLSPLKTKDKPRKCHLFSKADWEKIEEDLKPLEENLKQMEESGKGINDMWEMFKETIKKAVEENVPSVKHRKKNDLPWINRRIRKLLKRKKRLHARAKKTQNWANYRFCQKLCRRELRKAEQVYINDIIEAGMKQNDSKPFWRYVRARKQENTGVAPLKEGTGLVTDSQSKARILLNQFCSVFTKDDGSPLPEMQGPPQPTINDLVIQEAGVAKLLRNLNPSKASGPDQIPSKVLKHCAETLAAPLTRIFNASLNSGQLPTDWLTANISCVFKKGDRNRAENYRPVSLTSVSCKLLEHILCHHIRSHLEKHNILTNRNHGFRSGFSCETQLLTTVNDLQKSNNADIQTDVIVLDFSKAFDTVPHKKLLHKLQHYGIKGPVLKWIQSFLINRTMKVVLEGESSDEAAVESGVPQGTVLGPLLFLCHINDLPTSVKSTVRLFADDCLLYRQIKSMQDHILLQKDLKSLEEWAGKWGMRFNAKKCFVLPTKKRSPYFYTLNKEILKHVDETPYLGVEISADLKWSKHVGNICKKASSKLGFLRRNLGTCEPEFRRMAYISLIRSSLEYGATVWDPYLVKDVTKLERIQRQAARFIKRDYRTREAGCVTNMLRDLNLPPLEERRKHQRLTTLYKISTDQIPALPPKDFLNKANKEKRKIKPKFFDGFQSTNIVKKYAYNNTKGFVVPDSRTEQYERSFFVRTVAEWNELEEEVVQANSVAAFGTALSRRTTRVPPP
jgi:hypothetical protein